MTDCAGKADADPVEIELALLTLRGLPLERLGPIDRLIAEAWIREPDRVRCKAVVRIIAALAASISQRDR